MSVSLDPTGQKAVIGGILDDRHSSIHVVDLVSGKVQNTFTTESFPSIGEVQWTSDGKSISFDGLSNQDWTVNTYIWKLGLSSGPQLLAPGIIATWSLDGSQLATVTPGNSISITDRSTGNSKVIIAFDKASKKTIVALDWSPDGNWLVLITLGENRGYVSHQLYRIQANGENLQLLFDDPPQGPILGDARWIDDGKWMAVLMGTSGDLGIKFVSADGKFVVEPLKGLKDIAIMDISDDASRAVVAVGRKLYSLNILEAIAPLSIQEV
ncbi:MAG: WD40 repeat domain-containing protein [Chloroflexota bacterium]